MNHKITSIILLVSLLMACGNNGTKQNIESNKFESFDESLDTTLATNENNIEEHISPIDGSYQNNNINEIFKYNNVFVKPKGLAGKWTNTMATVSFEGENRNTLILGLTTSKNENLKGVYVLHTYLGKNNGIEVFKYERVEGDNYDEYFTFSFGDDGKLTITNLQNSEIFILDNI